MASTSITPTALILVAVLNQPKDLEIARILGWYRIPLRSAPKVIAVDYLAFYQTSVFGDEKWRIQYVATVRGHELTTRMELLRDEPDHPDAQREYYKIELGPLVRLEKAVIADTWRRITFFYTTGEYLNKAHSIGDLVVPADERQILWQALRDRANKDQQYRTEDLTEISLNPEILAVLLGIKEIEAHYKLLS